MYTQKTSRFWINAMVTPFTLALALAALLGTESIVRADTKCTGTLTGTITGNVTVPRNASCTIEIATITGNVQVARLSSSRRIPNRQR